MLQKMRDTRNLFDFFCISIGFMNLMIFNHIYTIRLDGNIDNTYKYYAYIKIDNNPVVNIDTICYRHQPITTYAFIFLVHLFPYGTSIRKLVQTVRVNETRNHYDTCYRIKDQDCIIIESTVIASIIKESKTLVHRPNNIFHSMIPSTR